jgi:hypothetical protein
MGKEFVDRCAPWRRGRDPPQTSTLNQHGASSVYRPRESLRLDQRYAGKMLTEFRQLSCASPHHEAKRAACRGGDLAELLHVPIDPVALTAACRELESDDLYLFAIADQSRLRALRCSAAARPAWAISTHASRIRFML